MAAIFCAGWSAMLLSQAPAPPTKATWMMEFPESMKKATGNAYAFEGLFGWHWHSVESVSVPDQMPDALRLCRERAWAGYVSWRAGYSMEIDSCGFLRTIEQGKEGKKQ